MTSKLLKDSLNPYRKLSKLRKLVKIYNLTVDKNNIRLNLDKNITNLKNAMTSKDIKAVLKERNKLKEYVFVFKKRIGKYKNSEIDGILKRSLNFMKNDLDNKI